LESPEVHQPHGRHGGLPQWLELLIAVTALITSITSIVIALHHGEVMEKLVTANSMPYLLAGQSNAAEDGTPLLSVDLHNQGVGPAQEQSLRIKFGGRYVRSVNELIAATLGSEDAPAAQAALRRFRNSSRERFVAANSSQLVFRIPRTEANAAYWDRLEGTLEEWDVEYCYCSVFNDCWQVVDARRTPVKACVRDEAREFLP
jgi:hypothetical protein